MTSRVVGLVLVASAAVVVLSGCNLREGVGSEYGSMDGPSIDTTDVLSAQD